MPLAFPYSSLGTPQMLMVQSYHFLGTLDAHGPPPLLPGDPQVPMARASILWLIGEYCEHVPTIAPDVLRKMAKSFTAEEDIVKLQTINLAAKLYLTNSKQVAQAPDTVLRPGQVQGARIQRGKPSVSPGQGQL